MVETRFVPSALSSKLQISARIVFVAAAVRTQTVSGIGKGVLQRKPNSNSSSSNPTSGFNTHTSRNGGSKRNLPSKQRSTH
jgi:hypothetical protein